MDYELERAAVAQPHGGEMPDVACGEASDSQLFRQRDD